MTDLTIYQAEVQERADALTGASTNKEVEEVSIAARVVELAGGVIDRTVLDVQSQRIADEVTGATSNSELIVIGASLPREPAAAPSSVEVGSYVAGLFKGNSKYLACNGGTYLRSAYPDLTTESLSSLSQQVSPATTLPVNGTLSVSTDIFPSIHKFNGKFYRLGSGSSNTSTWTIVPIQVSTDGINFVPVAVPSMASPITSSSGTFQMDTMLANGTTLLAFGRMLCNGSNYIVQLRSQDDGKTWIFSTVRTVTQSYNTQLAPVLAAAIGNTVIAHTRGEQANTVYYSISFGGSWSTLSDTDVVNTKYINGLVEDGTRFMVGFSDGSSAYTAAADPNGTAWTAVAPPNANARGVLAVVSGKWVMGGTSGYVATATTPGTWVAQATCTSGMPSFNIDRILVNGTTIGFSGLVTTGGQVFYCDDASTLLAATAVVADSVANNPAKLILASVADGNFYLRVLNENIIRSVTLASASFSPVQAMLQVASIASFDTVNHGIVKKYGIYLASFGGAGQNKRFMSSDMQLWRTAPAAIVTGCGAVVDAGDRLLALDDNQVLWQSTDGLLWDATGITRPTLTGSPYSYAARLYVCENGWIYYYRFGSEFGYQVFVSKNAAATWTALSGFSPAGSSPSPTLQNSAVFTALNGKIYSLTVNYATTDYQWRLQVSSDGIAFTALNSGNINSASYAQENGVVRVDGVIYAYVGSSTSPAIFVASYDDGVTAPIVPFSFVPAVVVSLASTTSDCLFNRLSADPIIYRAANTGAIVRLTGASLTASASYALGSSSLVSPLVYYESGALKCVAPSDSARGPLLSNMPDSNTTFTLPSIANTWLRAAE